MEIPVIENCPGIFGSKLLIYAPLAAGAQSDKKRNSIFERKRGMDSYLKEKNWTGSTGSLG